MKFYLMIAVLMSAVSGTVFAAGDVTLNVKAYEEVKEVDKKGKEVVRRIEPVNVTPGDTVVYAINFKNSGQKAAENAGISIPIPSSLTYIDGSVEASGYAVKFSVDSGKSYSKQNQLYVIDKDGNKVLAQASDYTHIHWLVPAIKAGQSGRVSYKALVK